MMIMNVLVVMFVGSTTVDPTSTAELIAAQVVDVSSRIFVTIFVLKLL